MSSLVKRFSSARCQFSWPVSLKPWERREKVPRAGEKLEVEVKVTAGGMVAAVVVVAAAVFEELEATAAPVL